VVLNKIDMLPIGSSFDKVTKSLTSYVNGCRIGRLGNCAMFFMDGVEEIMRIAIFFKIQKFVFFAIDLLHFPKGASKSNPLFA
jgi:hypothetical protein